MSKLSNSAVTLGRRLLVTVAALVLPAVAFGQFGFGGEPPARNKTTFTVLNNPGDPNFNQLLGINDGRVIVGYFGDGATVANNGYVLVPKNHYAVENFLAVPKGDTASQTQAIGINNGVMPDIVGFYTDNATGFTHGFLDVNGVQSAVDDPAGLAPHVTTPTQNLLGINDVGQAAGFWVDNNGNEHGFVVQLNMQTPKDSKFTEIPPSMFKGAVGTQASGITNNGEVCGFWTDANGNNHGFFGRLGRLSTFHASNNATSTSPFGCNNRGEIVGSFTDGAGNVHGFLSMGGRLFQFDAPGSSQTAAFGVQGTLINGVNDNGDIVGFFSDGTKVDSFANINANNGNGFGFGHFFGDPR